jgi:hypothetical protein
VHTLEHEERTIRATSNQRDAPRSSNDPWQLRTLAHGGRPWKSPGGADPSARQELGRTAALWKSIGRSRPGRGDALRKESRPANPPAAEHDTRRRKAVPSEGRTTRRRQHRNSTDLAADFGTELRPTSSREESNPARTAREFHRSGDPAAAVAGRSKEKTLEHTEMKTENPNHTRRTPWRRARDGLSGSPKTERWRASERAARNPKP